MYFNQIVHTYFEVCRNLLYIIFVVVVAVFGARSKCKWKINEFRLIFNSILLSDKYYYDQITSGMLKIIPEIIFNIFSNYF